MRTCPRPTFRHATPDDAVAVADILIGVRLAFMPYAPSAHSEDEVRAWVREQLLPGGGVTVAEVAGGVVGLVATSPGDGVTWIDQMAVQPALVGQGVGAALLDRVLRASPWPIRLYTFQANARARRFYERHGFVPLQFTDGSTNEECCPDVLYGWEAVPSRPAATPPGDGADQRNPEFRGAS